MFSKVRHEQFKNARRYLILGNSLKSCLFLLRGGANVNLKICIPSRLLFGLFAQKTLYSDFSVRFSRSNVEAPVSSEKKHQSFFSFLRSHLRASSKCSTHIPISARAFSVSAQKAAAHEYEFSASEGEMRVAMPRFLYDYFLLINYSVAQPFVDNGAWEAFATSICREQDDFLPETSIIWHRRK